jgi:hypothetical protein
MTDRYYWRIALGEQEEESLLVEPRFGPATEEEATARGVQELDASTKMNVQLTCLGISAD